MTCTTLSTATRMLFVAMCGTIQTRDGSHVKKWRKSYCKGVLCQPTGHGEILPACYCFTSNSRHPLSIFGQSMVIRWLQEACIIRNLLADDKKCSTARVTAFQMHSQLKAQFATICVGYEPTNPVRRPIKVPWNHSCCLWSLGLYRRLKQSYCGMVCQSQILGYLMSKAFKQKIR